jgi:hypothetical protein
MTETPNHPSGPPFIPPSWRESLPALNARLEAIEKRVTDLEIMLGKPSDQPPATPDEGIE